MVRHRSKARNASCMDPSDARSGAEEAGRLGQLLRYLSPYCAICFELRLEVPAIHAPWASESLSAELGNTNDKSSAPSTARQQLENRFRVHSQLLWSQRPCCWSEPLFRGLQASTHSLTISLLLTNARKQQQKGNTLTDIPLHRGAVHV
jgi:hypothetical protein